LQLTRILWFLGLALLLFGSAIILNAFAPPRGGGSDPPEFMPLDPGEVKAISDVFYLGAGDKLTVSVDPTYPAISHRIILEKAGSDWTAEELLEGQGAKVFTAPVRGSYILTVEAIAPEEAPEGVDLVSFFMHSVQPVPRNDTVEPALYLSIIPGLVMIVASIYIRGKKS